MKMPKPFRRWTRGLGAAAALLATVAPAQAQQPGAKGVTTVAPETSTVLPFEPFRYTGNVGRTLADSDPPQFPKLVRPPKGAPNIVLILIDDAGYGQFGTFGGQVPTPALDSVAKERPALHALPHHGAVLADARGAAHGAQSSLDRQRRDHRSGDRLRRLHRHHRQGRRHHRRGAAPARLRHVVVRQESQHAGLGDEPGRAVRSLAERLGFDYFYGFMGGDMDQWQPTLYENHNLVPRSTDPNYILTKDLVDKSIAWLRQTRSIDAEKPFFLYMSTGRHARAASCAAGVHRQVQGAVRHGLGCLSRADLRAAEEARRGAAEHEADAAAEGTARVGFAVGGSEEALRADDGSLRRLHDETDHEMGRLLEVVRSLPDADNTIILYQVGDNGASAEGGLVGLLNENSFFNGVPESLEDNLKDIDELGGPKHFNHFPAGWALGDEHAVPVDEADRLAPRRRAQSARHLVAGADQGQGRRASAVPSRHRYRADDLRGVRHHLPDDAQRRRAKADRGRLDGLFVRLGESAGAPPQPILRDVRQPGHLQRWLVGRVADRHPVGERPSQADRPGHRDVGTLQPGRGLQPGERPRREEPRQTARTAGPVVGRSRALQRAAARWPQDRTLERGTARAPVADRQPDVVHLLPGHARSALGQRTEDSEQVVHDHGGHRNERRSRATARSSRSAAPTAATASTSAKASRSSSATSSTARSRA